MAVSTKEFEAGGLTVRSRPMPGRVQFHVARRLLGLLDRVGDLSGLASARSPEGKMSDEDALKMAGAVGKALASLPDDQADYVLDACLDVAEVRQESGNWAPLRARGVLMFPINMPTMITIAGLVLWNNLEDFGDALPELGELVAGLKKLRG